MVLKSIKSFIYLFLLVTAYSIQAEDKFWTCGGERFWDESCWSGSTTGQPLDGDNAFLRNTAVSHTIVNYRNSTNQTLNDMVIEDFGIGSISFRQFSNNLQTTNLIIGDISIGRYSQFGGTLTVNNELILGNVVGGQGTHFLTNTADLSTFRYYVGKGGVGNIDITNGATFFSSWFYLGDEAGADGTVSISDASTSFTIGELRLGVSGSGTFKVENGATANVSNTQIGINAGSNGNVNVDGVGSTLNITGTSGTIRLGVDGTGVLNINNGGLVSSVFGRIGGNIGSSGAATVDGVGSAWLLNKTLQIGSSNAGGILHVQNGGMVSAADIQLGILNGSNGSVIVSGVDSNLTSNGFGAASGSLDIGHGGTGSLTVQNGATVTSDFTRLGVQAGADGTVTIDGVGSTLNNSATLFVGGNHNGVVGGRGTINVSNQGVVNVEDDVVVYVDGTVNVGINSEINVTGNYIQNGGNTILNGTVNATIVELNSGTVTGSGDFVGDVINSGAIIGPGNSPGIITIDGNYTQDAGGILDVEVSDLTNGMYDQLIVLGTATFDEATTINFSFTDGFSPTQGDAFDFIMADIFNFDLALLSLTYSGLQDGFEFDLLTNNGQLSFIAINDGAAVVPVPAAVWLFGSGFLSLIGIARRKK